MLIRKSPHSLLNELNNIFDETLQKHHLNDDSRVEGASWIPAVDIKEEDDQFKFLIDIPGVQPENVDVSMENNTLTLKGQREEKIEAHKDNFHRVERVKGSFYRRFTLPDTAVAEHIQAKAKNGVLEISIGKKNTAQLRKIEVISE